MASFLMWRMVWRILRYEWWTNKTQTYK